MPEPMNQLFPLRGRIIALSVSESDDLVLLGLEPDHVREALERLTQHLLARGATVAYGGDLRAGGFTSQLLRFANRYCTPTTHTSGPSFLHYFPWPFHLEVDQTHLDQHSETLSDFGALILLARDGANYSGLRPAERVPFTPDDVAAGLTGMRRRMTGDCHARIILGGRSKGYLGRVPGVAEEAMMAVEARKPLLVLGGFGGAALDVAQALGWCARERHPAPPEEEYSTLLRSLGRSHEVSIPSSMLDGEDVRALAETRDIEVAVSLVLRSLDRSLGRSE